MLKIEQIYPDWLRAQCGVRYRGEQWKALGTAGWQNRDNLIRKYAMYLQSLGRPVTLDALREMLQFVDRGYSLGADQISRALARLYARGELPRYPNGATVRVGDREYRSIRQAAREFKISPQTVINRSNSSKDEWGSWQMIGKTNRFLARC